MNNTSVKKNKIIYSILLVCGAVFFYLFIQVVSGQNDYKAQKADAAVILGHSLEDGNLPGSWLIKRLETGLEVYHNKLCNKIIVTGGEGPRDNIAVALSMEQWLMDNGVPPDDIIVEINAKNTYENFLYVKTIADEQNISSIIVVTNDFHMYRSMTIGSEFFPEIYGEAAPLELGVRKTLALLKEPLSLVNYYVTLKGW